jgi:hypothetical protein
LKRKKNHSILVVLSFIIFLIITKTIWAPSSSKRAYTVNGEIVDTSAPASFDSNESIRLEEMILIAAIPAAITIAVVFLIFIWKRMNSIVSLFTGSIIPS